MDKSKDTTTMVNEDDTVADNTKENVTEKSDREEKDGGEAQHPETSKSESKSPKKTPKKSPAKKSGKGDGALKWPGFFGYRCHFVDVIKQSRSVMSKFDAYTMNVLQKTAFFHFFSAIYEGKINEQMVDMSHNSVFQLLKTYKHESGGFVLNPREQTKSVKLSPKLTSMVFGIAMKGSDTKELDREFSDQCDMYSMFFEEDGKASRKEIREAMEELLEMENLDNGDKMNLVKLLIMYSFSAFFFSSTSSILPKTMLAKFNSIETLNKVCWPKEITQRLQNQVVKNIGKPKSVTGCVYLMLYMLLEHTNVIDPLGGEECLFPRMLRWDLSNVTTNNWDVIQKKLLNSEVKLDLNNISEMESRFLDGEEEMNIVLPKKNEVDIDEVAQIAKDLEKNTLEDLCAAALNERGEHVDSGEIPATADKIDGQTEELMKTRKATRKASVQRKEDKDKKKMKKEKKNKKVKIVGKKDESPKNDTVSEHVLTDFAATPMHEVEESYGTEVFLDTLTNNVYQLKHLLRKEKTKGDKLIIKCNFLERLVKTREVGSSNSEGQKLNAEILLLEDTYKQALKSFNEESVRNTLYMQSMIDRADTVEEMYNKAVDELQKERIENKWRLDDLRDTIKKQTDTLVSCRAREINMMEQITEMRNNLEKKDQDFEREMQIYKDKVETMENDGKGERMEQDDKGDQMELIKELQRENSELKSKEVESQELYLKLKEEYNSTCATAQDKIKTLQDDKVRILGKLKKAGDTAAENRVLRMTIETLEKQIAANASEPLAAVPLNTVGAEEGMKDNSDKKGGKWSSIKTRSRRLRVQQGGERKEIVHPQEPPKKKARTSKTLARTSKNALDVGLDENGQLQDPTESPFWEDLLDETKVKLQKLRVNGSRQTQVWYSEVPSPMDTIQVTAICLEDIYMNRYISAEIIDWYLIYSLKDYAPTTTQELRTISLRANAYDSWSIKANRSSALDDIQMHIEAKILGGERYILVPMRSSSTHWSLLYFDVTKTEWHYYNSLGADEERMNAHFKAAKQFKTAIQKVIQPVLTKVLGYRKIDFANEIVRHEDPAQTNERDCGIYICIYAHKLAANLEPKFTEHDAVMMRTIWTSDLLCNTQYSVDVNNTPDMLQTWMNSDAGRASLGMGDVLAIENTPVKDKDGGN